MTWCFFIPETEEERTMRQMIEGNLRYVKTTHKYWKKLHKNPEVRSDPNFFSKFASQLYFLENSSLDIKREMLKDIPPNNDVYNTLEAQIDLQLGHSRKCHEEIAYLREENKKMHQRIRDERDRIASSKNNHGDHKQIIAAKDTLIQSLRHDLDECRKENNYYKELHLSTTDYQEELAMERVRHEEELRNLQNSIAKANNAVAELETMATKNGELRNKLSEAKILLDQVIWSQSPEMPPKLKPEIIESAASPKLIPSHHQIHSEGSNGRLTLESTSGEPEIDARLSQALKDIMECQQNADGYAEKLDGFNGGTKEDKMYLHLKEMLLREIIKLDNIDSEGKEEIRTKRREVVKYLQELLEKLNQKVIVNK